MDYGGIYGSKNRKKALGGLDLRVLDLSRALYPSNSRLQKSRMALVLALARFDSMQARMVGVSAVMVKTGNLDLRAGIRCFWIDCARIAWVHRNSDRPLAAYPLPDKC
jgi:hypothetical protein